jgi:hypothetical protein
VSVNVKLGRWRTRDGREVVVDRELPAETCGWRFVGAFAGEVHLEPRLLWSSRGDFLPTSLTTSEMDLTEYIGPLDPAPFDLAAFIAGLKPGDVYRQNDGNRGRFLVRDGEVFGVREDNGSYHWLDGSPEAMSFAKYPAGPWVGGGSSQVG